MQKHYKLVDNRLSECGPSDSDIALFVQPDDEEKRHLVNVLKIDEHTLQSSLDPDELTRLEFEPDHTTIILKRPKNYSSRDNFLFRVSSTGIFLFKERLVFVLPEDAQIFEGKFFNSVSSRIELILKVMRRTIFHFQQHLRVINAISEEVEREINTAMENKNLINLFSLEKSLVYYHDAINCNGMVMDKIRVNAAKIGLSQDDLHHLEDIIIDNSQSNQLAQIYSNILASLMDARASIVANNLNVLMKNLNVIMIALMLPTLVVSIFSMNVSLPLPFERVWSFWLVILFATVPALAVIAIWRHRKL